MSEKNDDSVNKAAAKKRKANTGEITKVLIIET